MKFTKNLLNLQNNIKKYILDKNSKLLSIFNCLYDSGADLYLVGGTVRDLILYGEFDISSCDIDIEVHNLSLDNLENILKQFGKVDYIGKSFGILKIWSNDKFFKNIDWSVPRVDSIGRKPQVNMNSNLSIQEALKRRDLTINAMAVNLKTYEFIDPFGGLSDLDAKILKSPDILLFAQDPLRFYRVMQFISRFEMYPDIALSNLCSTMNIADISIERVEGEFFKLLLKSTRPSLGIRWLLDIGVLKKVFPELYYTVGILQDKKWHPEGDVFEHSMQALDVSAKLDYDNEYDKLVCMLACLCHDLGKVTTTKILFVNNSPDKIISHGHEIAGIKPTKALLSRITHNKDLKSTVVLLVEKHMAPLLFAEFNAGGKAYKKLALFLSKYTNLKILAKVACADKSGRSLNNKNIIINFDSVKIFIENAIKYGVLEKFEKPVLTGKDIIQYVSVGPLMGKLLKEAYKYQLETGIVDKEALIKFILIKNM